MVTRILQCIVIICSAVATRRLQAQASTKTFYSETSDVPSVLELSVCMTVSCFQERPAAVQGYHPNLRLRALLVPKITS